MNPKERGIKLLDAIVEGNQNEAFKLLRDGADLTVQRKGDSVIHIAARAGNLDIIKELKGVDLELCNQHRNTAAHYAATGGFVQLIQFFKTKGVNLNVTNEYGFTPLHEAVIQQPMDIIESFIDLGMDPNKQNPRTGETPAHIASMYGRRMAIEALLLRGANLNIRDNCQRKPSDVAKDDQFQHVVRMYETKAAAFEKCSITAAGMKLTNITAFEVTEVERVGIILEGMRNLDITRNSPASFYCRREKYEEASVPLKHCEDEQVFSDVFFFLISNATSGSLVSILLPLYALPSEKEELVLRFISSGEIDRPVEEIITVQEAHYVSLETMLIPEVTCICLVYSRPRQEEVVIANEGGLVEIAMEEGFSLDIPPGAFESDTMFSFKVFESQDLNVKPKKTGVRSWGMKPQSCPLLTSVFDIKISGQQPKKAITVQMPVTGDTYKVNEMVVLRAEINKPLDPNSDVLPVKPKFINNNLIFTISHFSTYVAVPKELVATEKDLKIVQGYISHARERRKPATFFAAVKHIDGRSFILLVDLGLAKKTKARCSKWKEEGFKLQKPSNESEAFMVLPGERFFAHIQGQATFEDPREATEQRFCFSVCRNSCHQTFKIQVDKNAAYSDTAYGEVVVYKPSDNADPRAFKKEVCRLRVNLTLPHQETKQKNDNGTTSNNSGPVSILKQSSSRASLQNPNPRSTAQTPTPSLTSIPRERQIFSARRPKTSAAQRTIEMLTQKNMLTAIASSPKKVDNRQRQIEPCQGAAYLQAHRRPLPRSKSTM